MHEIRKERQRPTYRRRRRRLAAILVPAALLGIAATSYVILKSDEVVAAGIGCYDAADEGANVAIVSTTGEAPVQVCKELWARGDIGSSPGEVPTMTACINSGGAVAVFPTSDDDVCTRLGLQNLPEDYQQAARRFVRMRDALIAEMYEAATAGSATERDACLTQQRSLDVAERVLAEHDFDDWTAVVATGEYQGRECANDLGFDDKDKKVLIIPSGPGIDPDPFGPH